jgi:hypothetical protein
LLNLFFNKKYLRINTIIEFLDFLLPHQIAKFKKDFKSMKTKKQLKLTVISLLVFALGAACQPRLNSPPTTNKLNLTEIEKTNLTLTGKVEFNLPEQLNIKSSTADVGINATVALINTSTNVSVSSGVTDSSGDFSLTFYSSFTPSPNQVFVLQASKRTGGSNSPLLSLRTYVQWTGSGWNSITGGQTIINKETTALTIIEKNNSSVNPPDVIGKISVSGGNSTLTPFGTVTVQLLTDVTSIITEVMNRDLDPVQYIEYNGVKYQLKNPRPVSDAPGDLITYREIIDHSFCDEFFCDFSSDIYLKVMNADGTNNQNLNNEFVSGFGNSPFGNPLFITPDRKSFFFEYYPGFGNSFISNSNIGSQQTAQNFDPVMTLIYNFSVSPDGEKFLFRYTDGVGSMWYISDGAGTKLIEKAVDNFPIDSSAEIYWSSDSKYLFVSGRAASWSDKKHIQLMDLNTGNFTDVSPGINTDIYSGTWSPDNKKILFRAGTGIYVTDISNPVPVDLAAGLGNPTNYQEFWSPDSNKVLWTSIITSSDYDFYVANANGTNRHNLTSSLTIASVQPPENPWSPDSAKVTFDSKVGSVFSTYLAQADGSSTIKISPDNYTSVTSCCSQGMPSFSPDGAKIMFRAKNASNRSDLFVANGDGTGSAVNITSSIADSPNDYNYILSYTPKKDKVLVYGKDGNVYIVNKNGTGLTDTGIHQYLSDVKWLADGRRFIYTYNNDIYLGNTDGSPVLNLTNDTTKSRDNIQIHVR